MRISDFKIGTKPIVGFIVVIAIFGAAIYDQIDAAIHMKQNEKQADALDAAFEDF